ncbi:probable NAD(P)H-hydrate epimerase [Nakaseomyces glabratus]|nr:probable NAD(P)H-hydrate epimerase [Nakaseomyces glabratus]SLM15876.1 probable NAD(P)H-hydrate epimerase [Nakaseomyces glabratus]
MSALKVVSSKLAAEIDQELMGPQVGFTLQQLMELAGFSVAQAVSREFPLSMFYPKRSERTEFYKQLVHQLNFFKVPVLGQDDDETRWLSYLEPEKTLCIVDAIFGFSFKPPMREPFQSIMSQLKKIENDIPIISVDVPLVPKVLVSLTVPKLCSNYLKEKTTKHYVGGRFVPRDFANKYGFEPFAYEGTDQVLKL